MTNEVDTCLKQVVPKLQAAGWDNDPHSIAEQRTVTDGRVIPVGKGFVRKPPKRVDYLLRHNRDFPLAVVEAKASYKTAADAVQQARSYAEMLGLKFAYATNGADIIEIDYFTGRETRVPTFPTPDELWQRYQVGSGLTSPSQASQLLAPYNHVGGKNPRYYQQIAINRTIEAILNGKQRVLLTMATGTGKTVVAFQICWKFWSTERASTANRASSSLPPKHPDRRSQGQDVCSIRGRPPQDRVGRDHLQPRNSAKCISRSIRRSQRMNGAKGSSATTPWISSISSLSMSVTAAAHGAIVRGG
jgi:hypothetical protein